MKSIRSLAAVVVLHLLVSMIHGAAHTQARVALSAAATVFVVAVILVGPLVGLVLTRWAPRTGTAVIAATMAGALVFGVVNHFVIAGADHVTHVDPQWRTLFASTAVVIAILEVLGVVLAVRAGRQTRPQNIAVV